MRRPFVAGNWKMNLTLASGRELVARIADGLPQDTPAKADVAVCPPAVYLHPLAETTRNTPIALGAQTVHEAEKGAFTGEIAAEMAADVGCRYVILGHSERRHTIGHLEDDRMINLKVRAVQRAGLCTILCVGETLDEREADQTFDVVDYQLWAGLHGVKITNTNELVIAYEPVWAIGTGRTASPEQAQEVHAHVRKTLSAILGDSLANDIRILYGGSVKADNAQAIFEKPDVDGGLIGGASLKADAFLPIVSAALATAT